MKKKLGILSLLALATLVPTACGSETKSGNSDDGTQKEVDNLESEKIAAILELDQYLSDELTKYGVTDSEQKIASGLNDFKSTINNASSSVQVSNGVIAGKQYVDECVNALFTELLKNTKENAIKQLNNYVTTRLEEEEILTTAAIISAITNGESSIKAATTVSDVESALNSAKENIDLLIASIKDNDASIALNNIKSTKLIDLDNYVSVELNKNSLILTSNLESIISAEKVKINAATTIEGVNTAYDNAIDAVDAEILVMLNMNNEALELENYKTTKKEELGLYASTKAAQAGVLVSNLEAFVVIGQSNIDVATTKDLVDDALESAKTLIDNKVEELLNQNAQEQLAAYKVTKKAYLSTKADSELTVNGVTDDGTVYLLVNTYKENIETATSISGVDAIVSEFEVELTAAVNAIKAAMDAVNALESAKTLAKVEIESYATTALSNANLTDDASSAAMSAKVSSISSKIDEKTTPADVETAVSTGKTEIDQLVSSLLSMSDAEKLEQAKSDAKAAISSYATAQLALYNVTDDGSVNQIVTASCNTIDSIINIGDVELAVTNAKTSIDSAIALIVSANEAAALATAKTNAISSLEAYLAQQLAANNVNGNVDLTEGKALINSSTTISLVSTNLDAAKELVDEAIKDLVNEKNALELATTKSNAKAELEQYKSDQLLASNISDDGSVASVVTLGNKNIDDAISIEGVSAALATAKNAVNQAINTIIANNEQTQLQAAKTAALSEISNYAASQISANGIVDDGSISAIVNGATSRINVCGSVSAVTSITATIKLEIDQAILTIKNNSTNTLEDVKAEAISALNSYMISALASAGVSDTGTVATAKNNGVQAINNATNDSGVASELEAAKDNIDSAIAAIVAAELESYKTAKKSELDTYATQQMAIYGVTNYDQSISSAIETGKISITSSTSKAIVDAQLATAKSNVLAAIKALVEGDNENTGDNTEIDTDDLKGTVIIQGKVEVIESSGWIETGYVKFNKLSGYDSYNVYVKSKGAADSTYIKIDDMLIRDYGDYVRADMLGLRAGSYIFKVAAVKSGTEDAMSVTTCSFKCIAQEREGFAWASYSTYQGAGAYNSDGTVSSGTTIVYVTNDNYSSVQATIGGTSCTGIDAIMSAQAKAAKSGNASPLIVRIIGEITNGGDYLEAKGSSAYSNLKTTIEGVGDDAWLNGTGIKYRNAGNVEVSNLGIRDFSDDGVTIDTDNCNVWVHNCDFFYGVQGSGDKAKGDGSLDCKGDSQYLSFNNNHFWDTGKVSLCGMTSETGENWISYYNNWFDHSDSRHPRVRTMSVHVYNNYYDGVAKYGVGAAKDSNVFVESNFFRSCKYPMLASLQGNDIYDFATSTDKDKGTFSGETGGVIKSYDNHMEGEYAYQPYVAGDSLKSVHFDAYEATSRDEQVPSTVKSKSGGNVYNNFDTSSTFKSGYKYDVLDGEAVKDYVSTFAGRMYKGDFTYTFNNSVDDTNYDIDTNLRSALNNYKSKLVKVLGSTAVVTVGSSNATNTMPESEEEYTALDFTNAVDSIGTVTYTASCLSKINNAYSIYNELDATLQAEVTSAYQTLEQKKAQYEALKATAQQAEIDNVITLIDAIGTVNANSGAAINAARTAYDALTSEQKSSVTNYSTLVSAEEAFEQYAVQNVINLINSLADANTATTKDSVTSLLAEYNSVLAIYNNLTNDQKTQVTNYSKLSQGINTLEVALAPYTVIELINAIPATVTISDGATITAARTAYNALTTAQQALVTNYDVLVAAEALYEELASAQQVLTFDTGKTGDNDFFTVSGNLKSGIAAKTYNGVTYTTALKMESATSITFTLSATQTVTLITDTPSIKIKINGTSYTTDSNGVVSIDALTGGISVTKDNTCNLYAIIVG